ncbi:MAG: ribosome maturation factor RimM [Candidatus Dormibacteria bacterium]
MIPDSEPTPALHTAEPTPALHTAEPTPALHAAEPTPALHAAEPTPALRAAQVRRPHGVRGEVRLIPLGGDPGRFRPGLRLAIEGGTVPDAGVTGSQRGAYGAVAPASAGDGDPGAHERREVTIASARPLEDGDVLVTFSGVDSRDQAQALTGAYLCVGGADIRQLGADEWFVHELVGLRALTPAAESLGTVSDVEEYPGQDMLVVSGPAGERRFPMARAFIERVDIAAGVVVVTPWEEA